MNTQFISGVNDLITLAPDVAAMWDYDKNPNGITPSDVSVGTSKKYWFKCPICHTSEYVSVKVMTGMKPDGTSFKSKRRCRRCRGDHDISTQGALIPDKIKHKSNSLIELLPDLVTQYWDYEKNNELGVYPESIGANSNITAWWICSECGKSFPMRINKRTGFISELPRPTHLWFVEDEASGFLRNRIADGTIVLIPPLTFRTPPTAK